MDKRILLLHPADNVYVVCQSLGGNQWLVTADGDMLVTDAVAVGHKIARRAIAGGQPIVKYGVSIGSAVRDVARGDHVHLHNMRSDYIASHARGGKRALAANASHH